MAREGYNQFLIKGIDKVLLNQDEGLLSSDLGPKQTMSIGDILEKYPNIPISLVVGDIVANSVVANSITSSMIQAGAVTATKLNVSALSAITANLGSITAGSIDGVNITGTTITGSTLQTGTVGSNIYITSQALQIRDGDYVYGTFQASDGTWGSAHTLFIDEAAIPGTPGGLIVLGGAMGALYISGNDNAYAGATISGPDLYFLNSSVNTANSKLVIPSKSGAYSGSNTRGTMGYDYTNHKLYVGEGGTTWKSVTLT